jgi:anti-sigma B factor antagonist
MALVVDVESLAEPVVVTLPAEIDVSNAGEVATQFRAAIDPHAGAVIADLTSTAFCDSTGVRILVLARDWATTNGVELRLVAPPGPTLVVLRLIGLDQLLRIYPTLDEAVAAEPVPHGQLTPGDPAKPITGATPEVNGNRAGLI